MSLSLSTSRSKKQKGQGLVEYALILTLVGIVVIAAAMMLGPQIGSIFSNVNSSLSGIGGGSGDPGSSAAPTAVAAPTMTYQQWCASLGAPYHMNGSGVCVKGN